MIYGCPGQDKRNVTSRVVTCPGCGYGVEIFSDELTRRCPQCGEAAHSEKTPSCAEWCPAARECIGEKRWQQLKGG